MAEVTREHRERALRAFLGEDWRKYDDLSEWAREGGERGRLPAVERSAQNEANAEDRERQAAAARIREWAADAEGDYRRDLLLLADDIERGDTASEGEVR